ncbi:efflux RND transporter periplasmic adaptor subunit [Iodidimonas sp. SYSU 1G8]|uniref:efflux RND transporter periplasmic adaptor subunit n=1 Tax=Iodidimonas sp. SYSU 1G8 TaxID=3133967 RepID=UPI0031FEF070
MSSRSPKTIGLGLALMLALAACGDGEAGKDHAHGAETGHADEAERGPHNGRLLRDGDFALEVTIFETGAEPRFRLYAYKDGKPVAPSGVGALIAVSRLGGDVDRFRFRPEDGYLAADGTVKEPHSFDVTVTATYAGEQHAWRYESYEGRTVIDDDMARQSGIVTEKAGPASIATTVEILGRVAFAPGAEASVKARFPGKILSLTRQAGDSVKAGEVLARVESNESLQTYSVTAPIGGLIVERAATVGDMAGGDALYRIGDPGRLVADFHVFDRDMARIRPGMEVDISPVSGGSAVRSTIASFLPVTDISSQSVLARAPISGEGRWIPGMSVRGRVIVEESPVPLAVRTAAIQRFRDFEVVFARVGNTYEVRMLELGRRTPEWTEVLGGLAPGQDYVTGNSYLIKADIEKSGASHDH